MFLGTALLMLAMLAIAAPAAAFNPDVEVSVGSPSSPFSQNKQNEPGLAVDAHDPLVLAAGANDNIDLEACNAGDPTTCPFTPGVGVSGIYFSFDGGTTWTQPTYTGWTARDCLGPDPCEPEVGPIGTLPWYYENGLVSNGDPALVFGPRPGADGTFSWANGSRLYYANITTNFSAVRNEQAFKGSGAIGVSRTDDPQAAAAGDKSAWMEPVIVTKQSSALFSDKEQIWADNAESSPHFGNVYICNVGFRSNGLGGAPEPVLFARSTDGGATFSAPKQVSRGDGNATEAHIAADETGRLSVVWVQSVGSDKQAFYARSDDNGQTFSSPLQLTSRPGTSISKPVALAYQNVVYVAYQDEATNRMQVFLTRSDDGGASFADAVQVSNANNACGRAHSPAMAVDSQGTLHIVWIDASHVQGCADEGLLFYSRSKDGRRLSAEQLILAGI